MRKVSKVKIGTEEFYSVIASNTGAKVYARECLIALLKASDCLRTFAKRLGISPLVGRRLLELARFNYVVHLHRQYKKGATCFQVAQDNGLKLSTLLRLFREQKLRVQRGVRRPRVTPRKLIQIWRDTETIIGVARKLGIARNTARNILLESGLIQAKIPRYRRQIPPEGAIMGKPIAT